MTFIDAKSGGFKVTVRLVCYMRLLLALALVGPYSQMALACSCTYSPLSAKVIEEAQAIFSFALVSSRLITGGGEQPFLPIVRGDIEILNVYRGAPNFREVYYSTLPTCCGSRFNVGGRYLAFASNGDESFYLHSENAIELEVDISEVDVIESIEAIIRREGSLDELFPGRYKLRQLFLPVPCRATLQK